MKTSEYIIKYREYPRGLQYEMRVTGDEAKTAALKKLLEHGAVDVKIRRK